MADIPGSSPKPSYSEAQQAGEAFIKAVRSEKTLPSTLSPEARDFVRQKAQEAGSPEGEKLTQALNSLKDLKEELRPSEHTEGSLSFLFEGAKSDLMKGAPKLIDSLIDPSLNEWKPALTGEQKQNIKIAIIDRIVSGAASQAFLGTMKGKLDKISEKFSKFDIKNISLDQIDGLTKEFSLSGGDDDKKGEENGIEAMFQKQVGKILEESIAQIRAAHHANPKLPFYDELLMHPKALADYKTGEDIQALLARSGNATLTRVAYREGIKAKILQLESTILSAEGQKNKVMDFLAKIPESFSGMVFGSLEWLFKIPILGDLIAAFFGYSTGKNLLQDLKLETKERKSLQTLIEYGLRKNDTGSLEKGSTHGHIKLLENIDFSEVDFSKLKPFYKILRKNGIDANGKDFWKSIFETGSLEIGEGKDAKKLIVPKWESGKETATTLIKKLNDVSLVPIAPVAQKPEPKPVDQKLNPAGSPPATPQPEKGPTAATAQPPATPSDDRSVNSVSTSARAAPAASDVPANKPRELPDLTEALQNAFLQANTLPFSFEYKGGKEMQVSAVGSILHIGEMQFKIQGKKGVTIDVSSIKIIENTVEFDFLVVKVSKPKNKITQAVPSLLNMEKSKKIEIVDEEEKNEGTLIITRIA